jgi:hypothetical protein
MSLKRIFPAFLIGSIFAALSALMIQFPDRVGAAAVFLLPGFVLGIVTSGNVHAFSSWVAALGNFVFYFGVTYLASVLWEKHTHRVDGREE